MNIRERLWRLLPDKCQVSGCGRNGIRGNENSINGITMCDCCATQKFFKDLWTKLEEN